MASVPKEVMNHRGSVVMRGPADVIQSPVFEDAAQHVTPVSRHVDRFRIDVPE